MANNVTEVFRVAVPSVGLVLKARADIDGKQDAFVRRVKEDARDGEVDVLTEYSANMDCVFYFNDGEDAGDIRYSVGEASVNLSPEDFEKLPSWREVKNWPGKVVGVCDYKARHAGRVPLPSRGCGRAWNLLIALLLRYEKVELIWGAVSADMTPKNPNYHRLKKPQKMRSGQ